MYLVWMPAPSRFVNVLRSVAYLLLGINKACVLVGLAEGADICAVIVEVISVVEMVNTVVVFVYTNWEYYCLDDHRPAGEDGEEMLPAASEEPLMSTSLMVDEMVALEEPMMGTPKSHAPLPLAQPPWIEL